MKNFKTFLTHIFDQLK